MERLKSLRNKKRLTQEGLAIVMHTSQSAISYYESGERFPDADLLSRCADYFHCSTDYLLERTDVKTPVDELVLQNLNAEEAELVKDFRNLSFEKKNRLIGFLEALKEG